MKKNKKMDISSFNKKVVYILEQLISELSLTDIRKEKYYYYVYHNQQNKRKSQTITKCTITENDYILKNSLNMYVKVENDMIIIKDENKNFEYEFKKENLLHIFNKFKKIKNADVRKMKRKKLNSLF